MNSENADFDQHARNYNAGFDDRLKYAIGVDPQAFLRPKLELLRRRVVERHDSSSAKLRLLDFGCGAADFLALMQDAGLPWCTEGAEVSEGMLAEARERWPDLSRTTRLWKIHRSEFPENSYDVITAICVFHHITPSEWLGTLVRLRRALRPGGMMCLFEHNSWNPVTRWMVSRTKIDEGVTLLSPKTGATLLREAGFAQVTLDHFLFVPPRWKTLGKCEHWLRKVPFGGQYLATATRSA